MYSEQDDSDLIYQLNNHNLSTFKTLYERYWVLLYMHARRILEDEVCAKDVVQDTFIYLYQKLGTLNPNVPIKIWLYLCVRNRAINFIRSDKARKRHMDTLDKYIEKQCCGTLELILEKDLIAHIDAEIENLPPKMRRAFELSWRDDLSHKEIASVTSTSIHTVHSHVKQAFKVIREKLSRRVLLEVTAALILIYRIFL